MRSLCSTSGCRVETLTGFTYEQLFQKIIDDFKVAYDVLPAEQQDGGRVNKIAAASYLAKCYLTLAWGDGYEATNGVNHINQEYMKKVVEYTDVVKSSQYGYLEDFGDIFLPEYKNSKESIFAVQCSDYKDDNTTFGRANWSNMLNGCWGIWSCGWDFHKPSQPGRILPSGYRGRRGWYSYQHEKATWLLASECPRHQLHDANRDRKLR